MGIRRKTLMAQIDELTQSDAHKNAAIITLVTEMAQLKQENASLRDEALTLRTKLDSIGQLFGGSIEQRPLNTFPNQSQDQQSYSHSDERPLKRRKPSSSFTNLMPQCSPGTRDAVPLSVECDEFLRQTNQQLTTTTQRLLEETQKLETLHSANAKAKAPQRPNDVDRPRKISSNFPKGKGQQNTTGDPIHETLNHYCKPCHRYFINEDSLLKHLTSSKRHIQAHGVKSARYTKSKQFVGAKSERSFQSQEKFNSDSIVRELSEMSWNATHLSKEPQETVPISKSKTESDIVRDRPANDDQLDPPQYESVNNDEHSQLHKSVKYSSDANDNPIIYEGTKCSTDGESQESPQPPMIR